MKNKYKIRLKQTKADILRLHNNPSLNNNKEFDTPAHRLRLKKDTMDITDMAHTQKYTTLQIENAEMRVIHFFKNLYTYLFSDKTYLQKRQQEMLIKELQLKSSELERIKNEMAEKDELMRKMSYHQNHTVRRPLANILGITKLIKTYSSDKPDAELQKLMELLQSSSAELDEAIKNNN